jgi:hypothetical protein
MDLHKRIFRREIRSAQIPPLRAASRRPQNSSSFPDMG